MINASSTTAVSELVQGVHMLSNETFLLACLDKIPTDAPSSPTNEKILNHIIPLDTYIDIKTEKGLLPGNVQNPNNSVNKLIGGVNNAPSGYTDLLSPINTIKGKSIRQVIHQYSIEHIEIKFWNGNNWQDYHPYEALYPNDQAVSDLKVGQFQKTEGKYNAIRILATTPFSYTETGERGWYVPEQYGMNASTLFCEAKQKEHKCTNFLFNTLNAKYYCANPNTLLFSNDVAFRLLTSDEEDYAYTTDEPNVFNFSKSLAFDSRNSMEILLPEPTIIASFKLSKVGGNGVKIKFYSVIQSDENDMLFNVVYGHPDPDSPNVDAPYEMLLATEDLNDEIKYNFTYFNDEWKVINPNWRPLSKIVVEPVFDNTIAQKIAQLTEQIADIQNKQQLIRLGIITRDIISTEPLETKLNLLIRENTHKDTTLIQQVCWLSVQNYIYNIHLPSQEAIKVDAQATIDGITKFIQPIWRPDTSYYIHFRLKDTVDNHEINSASFSYTYGFTTAGPVGYFHANNKSTYGELNSLAQYIGYNRSYPNADGNLLSAKPLFYDDSDEVLGTTRIYLFFNKAYATHFFQKWASYKNSVPIDGRLKVVIKDPVEDISIANPPCLDDEHDTIHANIPQTKEIWKKEENPQIPFAINQYLSLYNAPNCIDEVRVIKPASEYITIVPKYLKPNKLYTVIVNNLYDVNHDGELHLNPSSNETKEVHKFVFKTSRYKDFKEQIQSFYMKQEINGKFVERAAVFKFEKQFTQDEINAAYVTILNGLNDENNQQPITGFTTEVIETLHNNYQHPYDRILEGILGLSPWDEPISTEVNLLKDVNSDNVIALIVRNPESFNNPKFRKEVIADTIEMIVGDQVDSSYSVLFSKDNSQAIIMNKVKNITENMHLKFKYKIYEDLQPGDDALINYPIKREEELYIDVLNS